MTIRLVVGPALAAALVAVCSATAGAQAYESVGTRAQGMGGAFVAVADDATASWWNPAGLATGAYFNAVVERGRTTEPADPSALPNGAAARTGVAGFSVAFPAFGLSYYRLRTSELDGLIGSTLPTRQARSLGYSQFGVTVGQSLGDHFVFGSTVKLVRVGAAQASVPAGESALDAADELSVPVRTRPGLDVGAMASFRRVRLGVTVRNVKEVDLGTDADPIKLRRQARAGLAFLVGKHGFVDALTAAVDADVMKIETLFGDRRRVAGGVELWIFGRHLGLRGGLTGNTIGDLTPTTSVGASVAPWSSVYMEAAWSEGRDATLRGWTTSLRVTF